MQRHGDFYYISHTVVRLQNFRQVKRYHGQGAQDNRKKFVYKEEERHQIVGVVVAIC